MKVNNFVINSCNCQLMWTHHQNPHRQVSRNTDQWFQTCGPRDHGACRGFLKGTTTLFQEPLERPNATASHIAPATDNARVIFAVIVTNETLMHLQRCWGCNTYVPFCISHIIVLKSISVCGGPGNSVIFKKKPSSLKICGPAALDMYGKMLRILERLDFAARIKFRWGLLYFEMWNHLVW
jgi:hypothetical protein